MSLPANAVIVGKTEPQVVRRRQLQTVNAPACLGACGGARTERSYASLRNIFCTSSSWYPARGSFRVFEAPRQSGSDHHKADLFERLVRCGDLGHNITAVSAVRKHLLDAPNLTFHATKTFLKVVERFLRKIHSTVGGSCGAHPAILRIPNGVSRWTSRDPAVRAEGLEPSRPKTLGPKPSAPANSATLATSATVPVSARP